MCSVAFRKVFDEGRLERRTFFPKNGEHEYELAERNQRLRYFGFTSFSCKHDGFWIIGFCFYDCGDVLVTTARSARLNNCYKKARKWDGGGMVHVLT